MSPGDLRSQEDEELLRRFNEGDARTFEVILERYRRPVFNFVLRSVRDPSKAEDLLQEVFLRVVQRSEHFKGDSKFSTWLYTIARNLCIDTSRKMAFRRHRSLDAPARSAEADGEGTPMVERVEGREHGADRRAIAERMRTQLAAAVEELPDDQKEVFLMRQVQNLPFKEIAEIVGVPQNTVKSRMRYALERLREALAEYEDYIGELK
ncbi:MAG: RNA polymerase sigma factor [Polyangiales bacterium]